MAELRSYFFLDNMQPQLASFMASTVQGYMPVAGMASLFIEVAPGMEIVRLLDIAVKATDVRPAIQVVERSFGTLEVHADDQGSVRQAGQAVLNAMGVPESDRLKPQIASSTVIRKVDAYHASLINKSRGGSMLLGGQTLFILETQPALYAILAANEAEKASRVTLVDIRPFGQYGRLYLGGEEADVVVGSDAAIAALQGLTGRDAKTNG
ncbi:MAG TPA: BMC domain-containing protein [Candidatus Hydrogenedentes bacterium]|nr:BMC domain-containing protein [Candidatus Hydrogenedentota bacterium]HOS02603.1 BMC domain-containing protein [Candidatus Hydrogenedentota bacterium]